MLPVYQKGDRKGSADLHGMPTAALDMLTTLVQRGYEVTFDQPITKRLTAHALVITPRGNVHPIKYLPTVGADLEITYYALLVNDVYQTDIVELMDMKHALRHRGRRRQIQPVLVHDQNTSRRVVHPPPLTVLQTHQLLNHIVGRDADA